MIKHVNRTTCLNASEWLAREINKMGDLVALGPADPPISKIRNEFLQNILIKIPRNLGRLSAIKNELTKLETHLNQESVFRNVKIIFDVDPN